MDVGREAEEHNAQCDPGAGEAFPAGGVGLSGDRAGVEFSPPSERLAEGLDYGRRPGLLRRLGPPRPDAFGDGGDYLVGWDVAREAAEAASFEGSVGSERDFDCLLAVSIGIVCFVEGYVYNAPPDFGPEDAPSAVSRRLPLRSCPVCSEFSYRAS